jgi:hypothetical protein
MLGLAHMSHAHHHLVSSLTHALLPGKFGEMAGMYVSNGYFGGG